MHEMACTICSLAINSFLNTIAATEENKAYLCTTSGVSMFITITIKISTLVKLKRAYKLKTKTLKKVAEHTTAFRTKLYRTK